MSDSNLKPCPFCGGDAYLRLCMYKSPVKGYMKAMTVHCDGCSADVLFFEEDAADDTLYHPEGNADTIAAITTTRWNRRTSEEEAKDRKEEEQRRELYRPPHRGSEEPKPTEIETRCAQYDGVLTVKEYQELAQRTSNKNLRFDEKILNGFIGMSSEAGECLDVIKKWLFQDHDLYDSRDKLIEEMGDVAWYMVEAADALHVSLEDVLTKNINKLKSRYPEGFDPERSIHREEN